MRLLLLPLTIIYGVIIGIRNFLFDLRILKSVKFPVCVISVGNLTVGGTGKTPMVEYLIKILKENNFTFAVLSRGYKRKSKGFLLLKNASYKEIGDEPKQMQLKHRDIPIAVCKDRVKGIQTLIKQIKNLQVVILDDGFQHRYVSPHISILLNDFNRPFYNDYLLPYGRLRERARQKQRANIIITTKIPNTLKPIEKNIITKDLCPLSYQSIYFTKIEYGEILPVFNSSLKIEKNSVEAVLLLTGIAKTGHLKAHIQSFCPNIVEMKYPDHHNYLKKDIIAISKKFEGMKAKSKIIIMTEKDYVKINEIQEIKKNLKKRMFYIPIETKFISEEEKYFTKNIIKDVTEYLKNAETM